MQRLMDKIVSARERRFVALAKDEATCAGYHRYAPITRGRWMNGALILLLGLVAPFYLVWRILVRCCGSVKAVKKYDDKTRL